MTGLVAFVRTTMIVVLAVLLTLFVVQNLAPTEVNFMAWSIEAPRAVSVLASMAIGLAFGFLASTFRRSARAH